jgi:integrase
MPRKRGDGEGTLKKRRIAGRDVWWARWYAYDVDGTQRRPEKIIGTVKEFPTKTAARERMNELIRESTGRIAPVSSAPTFAEIWQRYVVLKTPHWSKANKSTVTCLFDRVVLPQIGARILSELKPEALQACLNRMVEVPVGRRMNDDGERVPVRTGYSFSAMQKALRYIRATFRFAIDEEIILKDHTKRLAIPDPPRDGCERFLSLDEVRRLVAAATGRERLVLRLLVLCGLRPGEVLALRTDDIEPGRLRIDEAVKDQEQGIRRIGRPKTDDSDGYVAISADLERELREWASTRKPGSLMFSTEVGTTWRVGNYLKRVLKPLAVSVGITDLTHQCLRRTFGTHFQRHGTVKDTQAQMRHSDPETTLRWYQKEIPDSVRAAVEEFDKSISKRVN